MPNSVLMIEWWLNLSKEKHIYINQELTSRFKRLKSFSIEGLLCCLTKWKIPFRFKIETIITNGKKLWLIAYMCIDGSSIILMFEGFLGDIAEKHMVAKKWENVKFKFLSRNEYPNLRMIFNARYHMNYSALCWVAGVLFKKKDWIRKSLMQPKKMILLI